MTATHGPIDPGPDPEAWARSIDWAHNDDQPRRCFRCGHGFRGRGPARFCRPCRGTCDHPAKVRGVTILRDGRKRPVFACLQCGGLIDARRTDAARWASDFVFRDLRTERGRPTPPCVRCGDTTGTQLHHWAPRAIFGPDAEHWPADWLCPPCHNRWHHTMRRAGGHRIEGAYEQGGVDLFAVEAASR